MNDYDNRNIHLKNKKKNVKKNKESITKGLKSQDSDLGDKKLSIVQLFKDIPQKIPFMGRPQSFTTSVALPVSLVENIQTDELRAYVVGNISRILTIYGINEVVLYNDLGTDGSKWMEYFALNLRFLETPQYLRRFLFPMNYNLKYTGLQNPIDAPHHLRSYEWLPYRDGVIKLYKGLSLNDDIYVNCGSFGTIKVLNPNAIVDLYNITLNDINDDEYQRVTIRLNPNCKKLWKNDNNNILSGYLVSPDEPLSLAGIYWGYIVREVDDYSNVFINCPFNEDGVYDYKIGTSEHGEVYKSGKVIPKYKNLLIVFGPINGLESQKLNPNEIFDQYLNFCPLQKSRTIRTEEALTICLSLLQFTSPHL